MDDVSIKNSDGKAPSVSDLKAVFEHGDAGAVFMVADVRDVTETA